jgi:ABC-type multidrug transport system permease subunit
MDSGGAGRELWELTRVRTVMLLREPEALFWVFVFPLVLAGVLGFAFQSSGPSPSVVAVTGDAPAGLVDALSGDDLLEVRAVRDEGEALLGLRNGRFDAVVSPAAPSAAGAPAEPPRVRLDPARPEADVARLRIERRLLAADGIATDGLTQTEEVEARGSRYVDFLFPGLLGMNLMGTGMWSIGFAVADLRRRKVLKRLLVTPMRRSSLLASFLLSRLVWLFVELLVLVAFGVLALGVPFRGGAVVFLVLAFLGATVFSGLGLLATARVKTLEAASGMLNLVMMPMWLASGVFFSYERFPESVQPALRLLPLTALNDALRAVMLDGGGPAAIASELAILAAWGVVGFLVALKIFRWQ